MTSAQYNHLLKHGKFVSVKVMSSKTENKPVTPKPATEAKGITYIKNALDAAGVGFMTELQFAKPRHTTSDGYTKNCQKYNLTASLGWKLYRYTFKNYRDFENDLKTILHGKENT